MATECKLDLRQMLQCLGGLPEPAADAELLERFHAGDDAAFATLVERHGPMVLATCRRVLGSAHDAEDAFQATFLVLARKSSQDTRTLAAWLHTVAHNLALDARKRAQRRRHHEQQAAAALRPDAHEDLADFQETRAVIDAELVQLPAKYRAALVLCYLEGKTHDEAAQVLECPRGSIADRLARGQHLLRQRLVRRGLTLAVAAAVLDSIAESRAAVLPALVSSTTQAARAFAAGQPGTNAAVLLAQGALRTMFINRLKTMSLIGTLAALCALGAGMWLSEAFADKPPTAQPARAATPEAVATLETVKTTVDGGNQFAFDLLGQLRKQEGNLFLSPYSISTALAMTSAGARGETDDQMVKVLHLLPGQGARHAAFAELIRLSQREKVKGVQLSVANALWGQQDYAFSADFLGTTEKNYGAGLRKVDFLREETARKTINRWVEQHTNDKIRDLIPPGVIDPNYTKLVLTNAIYFKGDWASKFKKDQTTDGPFFTAPDKQVQARLMEQTGEFKIYQDAELQALELPYTGNNLSMLVLLPTKKDGLPRLEASLTSDKLQSVLVSMGKSKARVVRVKLPRFKTESKFMLSNTLKSLGMKAPFEKADFSGMTEGPNGLRISEVIHQGFVEVNEEGTEAAAATAVVLTDTSAPPPIPTFNADHPFLFLIRDHATGSILFLGRLADPSK